MNTNGIAPISVAVKSLNNKASDIDAETKALGLLRRAGFEWIQQLDWIAKNNEGEWVIFEVKEKELFTPPPYYSTGLDKRQLHLRTKLLEELGLRTYLLIFVKGSDEVYGAYLDDLEAKGEFHDTKNDIRLYPIRNFKAIHNAPNQNLGGSA